jgi:hypothetical protein
MLHFVEVLKARLLLVAIGLVVAFVAALLSV